MEVDRPPTSLDMALEVATDALGATPDGSPDSFEPAAVVASIIEDLVPLAHAVGVEAEWVTDDGLCLRLVPTDLACNHLGTVYAGASFALAEVAAGAMAAIAARGAAIPVLVANEVRYRAPAAGPLRCTVATMPELADVPARLTADRRLASVVPVSCVADDTTVLDATFTYRWLGAR